MGSYSTLLSKNNLGPAAIGRAAEAIPESKDEAKIPGTAHINHRHCIKLLLKDVVLSTKQCCVLMNAC